MIRCAITVVLTTAVLLTSAPAQKLKVGDAAPPIECAGWVNAPDGKRPTPDTFRDRVVMLEFWGTWCGPCVRAMPHVQELHDRYRDRGLLVVAISYEDVATYEPFLKKHAYTMAAGSDPSKKLVKAYGIKSWPTTVLINKEGHVAHVGGPYDIEPAIETALGLESSPSSLLTSWMKCQRNKNKKERRQALERLVEKAPVDFDLRAWAVSAGGTKRDAGAPKLATASKLLDACVKASARSSDRARQAAFDALAAGSPESFDLRAWARAALGRAFPVTSKELKALLKEERFDAALDALIERHPKGSVISIAAKDRRFSEWCGKKLDDARKFAKKGLMIKHWVFAKHDGMNHKDFWRELSVSGMSFSKDRKEILGVIVGGKTVTRSEIDGFIENQLARSLLLTDLAKRKAPRMAGLAKQIDKERERILKPLERKYRKVPR